MAEAGAGEKLCREHPGLGHGSSEKLLTQCGPSAVGALAFPSLPPTPNLYRRAEFPSLLCVCRRDIRG